MPWTEFMIFISIPLVAIVAWIGRSAQLAHKKADSVRDDLLEYKTEVAQTYVSSLFLKDVEVRILKQLTKIEDKLDIYANGRK